MATNDFLVFGGGAGANVVTQAAWAALAARTAGFSSGVAQSAQLNKAWRQSSIMAAVLAQFISDRTGQDVLDDGTTATILANLKASAAAVNGDATKTFSVAAATQSQHAPQFGQLPAVVGSMRNARMSVPAASATATFTADEIVVESALGGLAYRLANFSQIINLGNVGAGGMDAGSSPANGFVALYAIYNPTTQARNILAANATSAAAPNVYGGANMPAGYTASALIGVWPTNGAGQFNVGFQMDRTFICSNINVLTTSTQQAAFTALSIASAVPLNARAVRGYMKVLSNSTGDYIGQISSGPSGLGQALIEAGYTSAGGGFNIPIITAQTMYYAATVSVGTMTATIFVTGYEF